MTDLTAAGAPPAGDAPAAPAPKPPVIVVTPPETKVAKPPSWLAQRLTQTSSKAAIVSVGTVWCGIATEALMPVAPMIAAAILPTFIGLLAFCWNESPDAVRIMAAPPAAAPAAIVTTPKPATPAA